MSTAAIAPDEQRLALSGMPWSKFRRRLPLMVTVLTLGSLCSLLLVKGCRTVRLMQASNNFKNIGIALHQYHEEYGTFPPAVAHDDKANKLHSWRSLIEPYMAARDAPPTFRFSEPWDSPHNLNASKRHGASDYEYTFLAIVGKDTAWPRNGPRTYKDFKDGTSNTIMVIAIKNPGIGWHEPVDLEFDGERLWLTHDGERREVSTKPCFILSADGAVHYLAKGIPEGTLKSHVTINDGDGQQWWFPK